MATGEIFWNIPFLYINSGLPPLCALLLFSNSMDTTKSK